MNTFAMVEPAALGYLAMDPDEPMPYVGSSRMLSNVSTAGIDAFLDAAGPGLRLAARQRGAALARRRAGAPRPRAPVPARRSTATT